MFSRKNTVSIVVSCLCVCLFAFFWGGGWGGIVYTSKQSQENRLKCKSQLKSTLQVKIIDEIADSLIPQNNEKVLKNTGNLLCKVEQTCRNSQCRYQ